MKRLVEILSDGKFHSGEVLAKELDVSRAAIWKYQKKLSDMGVVVYAVPRRGYRIPDGLSLLSHEKIRAALTPVASPRISEITVFQSITSTNQYLLDLAARSNQTGIVCLAEQQTDGRGRRGKTWVSPFGGNIYFSFLWRFDLPLAMLNTLSLWLAIKVMRALTRLGINAAGLKWPNDIFAYGKKLAGILLEAGGDAQGPCFAVMGIGLNVNMPILAKTQLDQPWIDCRTLLNDAVDRNVLIAYLIEACLEAIDALLNGEHLSLLSEWRQYDLLHGRPVTIATPNGNVHGIGGGIDETGQFILNHAGQQRVFHAGEVSICSPWQ